MTPPSSGSKLLLSAGFILLSAAYALWPRSSVTTAALTSSGTSSAATEPIAQPAKQEPLPGNTPTPKKSAGQYADGSYTGNAIDAYYGIVQVKAVIQNGRLADVQFLQYPNDRSTSVEISSQAMPLLTQEAIQAQSAKVDGVSGATQTSLAFAQSLGSALVKAKI
jgi:uncharacterized protein with FMN-binding domain